MADNNWQKVREVFNAALSRQPEERQNFVNQACGEDKILLAEISLNGAVSYFWLVRGVDMQGNEAQAFERLMRFQKLAKTDEETVQLFKTAYQTSGWKGVLREQVKQYEKKPSQPSYHAGVYAGAGDKDKAFENLENAYQRHENMLVYLQVDPHFDELVRRVGLK